MWHRPHAGERGVSMLGALVVALLLGSTFGTLMTTLTPPSSQLADAVKTTVDVEPCEPPGGEYTVDEKGDAKRTGTVVNCTDATLKTTHDMCVWGKEKKGRSLVKYKDAKGNEATTYCVPGQSPATSAKAKEFENSSDDKRKELLSKLQEDPTARKALEDKLRSDAAVSQSVLDSALECAANPKCHSVSPDVLQAQKDDLKRVNDALNALSQATPSFQKEIPPPDFDDADARMGAEVRENLTKEINRLEALPKTPEVESEVAKLRDLQKAISPGGSTFAPSPDDAKTALAQAPPGLEPTRAVQLPPGAPAVVVPGSAPVANIDWDAVEQADLAGYYTGGKTADERTDYGLETFAFDSEQVQTSPDNIDNIDVTCQGDRCTAIPKTSDEIEALTENGFTCADGGSGGYSCTRKFEGDDAAPPATDLDKDAPKIEPKMSNDDATASCTTTGNVRTCFTDNDDTKKDLEKMNYKCNDAGDGSWTCNLAPTPLPKARNKTNAPKATDDDKNKQKGPADPAATKGPPGNDQPSGPGGQQPPGGSPPGGGSPGGGGPQQQQGQQQQPPSCQVFASPSTVLAGTPVTLQWSSFGAQYVTIAGSGAQSGNLPSSGQQTITPQNSGAYTVTAYGAQQQQQQQQGTDIFSMIKDLFGGTQQQQQTATCSTQVTVTPRPTPPPPPATTTPTSTQPTDTQPKATLSCEPKVADVGATLAISFSCSIGTSAGSGFETGGISSGATTTTIKAPPGSANTATYSLTCTNEGKTDTASCTVQVAKPAIVFIANPKKVEDGETSALGWVTSGMKENSCAVSSPDIPAFTADNADKKSTNGAATTPELLAKDNNDTSYHFVLQCMTLGGATKSASTTVTAVP